MFSMSEDEGHFYYYDPKKGGTKDLKDFRTTSLVERGGCCINGWQLTHLFFADDTLVFYKDSRDQLAYLSWILVWFEAIFGLRINLEKN